MVQQNDIEDISKVVNQKFDSFVRVGRSLLLSFQYNKENCPTYLSSMTSQELKEGLINLSLADKAEIIQSLTKNLSKGGKGITKTPGVCGGEACIAGTRIAVWLLVEAQQLGISEAQLLQDYPHITAADLVNAWAYADAHPEEIAELIRANNEAVV